MNCASIQPHNGSNVVNELEQWCAELRTAEGIKRQLCRADISDSARRALADLLYQKGWVDALGKAEERVAA